MAYLLSHGKDPISVAEIKLELGLGTDAVDAVIAGGIATACSLKSARPSVWLVEVDDDFDARVDRMGRVKKMGSEQVFWSTDPRPYREVQFLPKPEAIQAAKAWVIQWCANQLDIHEALVRQRQSEAASYAVAAE